MTTIILLLLTAGAGYAAAIYTWPWLRQAFVGIENEIDELRRKARELERRLRG